VDSDAIRARLADRIREACKARDLPLSRLAAAAGVSRNHLFAVLAGTKAPTIDYLAKLARILEVDPSALIAPSPITARTKRVREDAAAPDDARPSRPSRARQGQ
jgi:transcriptional regulator with XRE-family HTH domain